MWILLFLLLLRQATAQSHFGQGTWFGDLKGGNFVRSVHITLTVPEGQGALNNHEQYCIWPGIETKGGLIQSLLERKAGDGVTQTPCETATGTPNWCAFAFTLRHPDGFQIFGEQAKIVPGQDLVFDYVYDDSTNGYKQQLSIDGQVVSTLSSPGVGHSIHYYLTSECATGTNCGTIGAHTWSNMKVVLDKPGKEFSHISNDPGVKVGKLSSPDGGKTWTVDSIQMPEYTYKKGVPVTSSR